jgi:hypothetical protein
MDKFPPKPPKGPNPDIAPFPNTKILRFPYFFGIPVFLMAEFSHKNPGNVKDLFWYDLDDSLPFCMAKKEGDDPGTTAVI